MSEVKKKVRQLYQFLKEANQLRFRPVRVLAEHPKVVRLADIPDHPTIQLFRPILTEQTNEVPEKFLSVKRPQLTRCPKPPSSIESWLLFNWDDPTKQAAFAESQNFSDAEGQTLTVRFGDDEQRLIDFTVWGEQRQAWAEPEIATRRAMSFFESLYDIYSSIEKDGEQYELLIADGHLFWEATSDLDGKVMIHHPILLKRVELRFDPEVPEFAVYETDREPEIYNNLFVDLQGIVPESISIRQRELENAGYHPLGWEDTEGFLNAFIKTLSPLLGEYAEDRPCEAPTAIPRLYRDPVLVLRKRTSGIANSVDAIIDDIERQEVFPPALFHITGTSSEWVSAGLGDSSGNGNQEQQSKEFSFSDDDILLAHEANEEQKQIIRKLEHSGSVIVQGPPGTGKTHTIGNLIGHLLAQGKSILVTAQTTKALRVLRDNVPIMLQPLAVAVLGSDSDAREQLKDSISSIEQRRTSDSADELLEKAKGYEDERRSILSQQKQLSHKLREALENEYKEIAVGQRSFKPADAARFVSSNLDDHGWIPGIVKLGAEINLTDQEIMRLYALGSTFTAGEEQDARYPLPDLAQLPTERQFQVMVTEYHHLTTSDLSYGVDRWRTTGQNSETLDSLLNEINAEFSDDIRSRCWRPYAIVAGLHHATEREVWKRLVTTIQEAVEANSRHSLHYHHEPQLSKVLPLNQQRQICSQICDYLDNGGKLGFLLLATRSEWRQFIKTTSVKAGRPVIREHFDALLRIAELEVLRSALVLPWDMMIGKYIQQPFNTLGSAPELACRSLIPDIHRSLEWHASVWLPLANRLSAEGLLLDELMVTIPREASQISEYLVIERLATVILPSLLAAEIGRRKLRECEVGFECLNNLTIQMDSTSPDRGCISRIVESVRSRVPESYSTAIDYARRLYTIKPLIDERDVLAKKLGLIAPVWSEDIINRVSPHQQGTVPGDVAKAWTLRQLHDSLVERDKLDAYVLQHELYRSGEVLKHITHSLIDCKAWGTQLKRLEENPDIRQALVGWLHTEDRLRSTRDVNQRNMYLTAAQKLMRKCAEAVPVWVMPISIVAESFDPHTTRFDVVIIDEASQADLNALIPIYLGKQVIIVGDHEQVTPLGTGKSTATLQNLIRANLQGIPNAHLFNNLTSIYDIGRQSFGVGTLLVEHFRCVPEIIAFSNQLSYNGKIKPLRESNSTDIKPACVGRMVDGIREGGINRAEARQIIDTIKAMILHPKYANKTIGIISMLSNAQQALLIQTMLHKEIPSTEIKKRRIQAGNPGEFQGDQRHIIFLSMVDSPTGEGPLRLKGYGAFELTKKRFNVAASRAQDQMWVMHSFDPSMHLKTGDIRLQLMNHVRDPLATIRAFDQEVTKTESPFERDVLKRLTAKGYRVKTQWPVGYLRIDMVVEGAGKRLAIECDGDRYHTMENLAKDMERQTILERVGKWQFVRIRGSAFYRNEELAMKPVFDRLNELGIPPEGDYEEPNITDMTLIHELDKLMQSGVESDEGSMLVDAVDLGTNLVNTDIQNSLVIVKDSIETRRGGFTESEVVDKSLADINTEVQISEATGNKPIVRPIGGYNLTIVKESIETQRGGFTESEIVDKS